MDAQFCPYKIVVFLAQATVKKHPVPMACFEFRVVKLQ